MPRLRGGGGGPGAAQLHPPGRGVRQPGSAACGGGGLEPDGGWRGLRSARALHARQLRTSRQALVRHLQAVEAPRAFAEYPLLRHLKPLPLEQGCMTLGRLRVRLDDELGLVYQAPLASPEDQA
ncbi:hypothetical protein [Azotobacter chroococcum]|uniref:hypothetical protein n=1 Tax=Azotobacter chroococcum TaxID=353 RepID=UPI003100F7E8